MTWLLLYILAGHLVTVSDLPSEAACISTMRWPASQMRPSAAENWIWRRRSASEGRAGSVGMRLNYR